MGIGAQWVKNVSWLLTVPMVALPASLRISQTLTPRGVLFVIGRQWLPGSTIAARQELRFGVVGCVMCAFCVDGPVRAIVIRRFVMAKGG